MSIPQWVTVVASTTGATACELPSSTVGNELFRGNPVVPIATHVKVVEPGAHQGRLQNCGKAKAKQAALFVRLDLGLDLGVRGVRGRKRRSVKRSNSGDQASYSRHADLDAGIISPQG